MLDNIDIKNILFLDIETVPMCAEYEQLSDRFKKLWNKKSERLAKKEDDTPEKLFERAGIYSEFGRIICISVGFVKDNKLRLKSFYSHNEKELLTDFISLCNNYYNKEKNLLCGHNAKEFDFPYIARRILVNNLKIPDILNIAGKKPWQVAHLDTMHLWRFGDYKNYTSLELLTAIFDIPTPKDDIDGSQVANVYWKENDIERIARYCEKDVTAVVQLFLKYQDKPLMKPEDIVIT